MRTISALVLTLAIPIPTYGQGQELSKELNEHVVMIPKATFLFTAQLETTIFKPQGDGPFPVVVVNHGKSFGINPRDQARSRPLSAARFFLQRGYAVVAPMRQGFSKSTGMYIGTGCNIEDNGLAQADDVRAVLDYLRSQSYADLSRVLVVGQSHGGWTTLAFGTLNYPGVRGLVNFAGGLEQLSCAGWEGTLARVGGGLGRNTKVPSLWFYGDNDRLFNPHYFHALHQAYTANGGKATLVAFGKFGSDAHGMFGTRAGEKIWQPEVLKFLQQLDLPREVTYPQYGPPQVMAAPPPTGFASLDKIDAVPYLRDTGKKGYATFLTKESPRAFAVAPSGAWGWANGGDDPLKRALDNCNKHGKGACRLYAVDDAVVWSD